LTPISWLARPSKLAGATAAATAETTSAPPARLQHPAVQYFLDGGSFTADAEGKVRFGEAVQAVVEAAAAAHADPAAKATVNGLLACDKFTLNLFVFGLDPIEAGEDGSAARPEEYVADKAAPRQDWRAARAAGQAAPRAGRR